MTTTEPPSPRADYAPLPDGFKLAVRAKCNLTNRAVYVSTDPGYHGFYHIHYYLASDEFHNCAGSVRYL